jgi:hypothetical protein
MTITKHFFGLVECYECQGTCYINNFGISPGFVILIQLGMILVIAGFLTGVLYYTLHLIKKYSPNKI